MNQEIYNTFKLCMKIVFNEGEEAFELFWKQVEKTKKITLFIKENANFLSSKDDYYKVNNF